MSIRNQLLAWSSPFDSFMAYLSESYIKALSIDRIISAVLTQWKITEPLREEKAPRHHLYLLIGLLPVMSVVVWFFDFFFGFFPDMMRLEMMLPLFLPSLAFFSPLFVGLFAVKMSLSKLANHEVDNESPISVTLP